MKTTARIGGVLYLMIVAIGLFGEMFVRGRIVVANDAAATAANMRSMESLWRLGIAGEYVLLICAVCLAPIFYILLRPVSKDLALLAVFFNLVSLAVEATAGLHLIEALFPLGDAAYLKSFATEQLDVLARLSIRSHGNGFSVALLFFGCFCIVAGILIFRSGYLPRVIGVLMVLAGASYLTNSFALILSPAFANQLYPVIFIPPFVGETSLALWFLVRGVNLEKWNAKKSMLVSENLAMARRTS